MARAVIGMLMGVVERETERVNVRLAQPALTADQCGNDISKAQDVLKELKQYDTLFEVPLITLKDRTKKLIRSIADRIMNKAELTM